MTDDRDLERLLGQLAEDGRGQPDPAEHPSDGTLSFYHARKLSPEEEDRVREHLVECKRCRDLLLEYAEFMADEEEEKREGVADLAAAADWQRLRARMGEEERKSQVVVANEPSPLRRFFGSAKTAYSIAAMLAVALIGLASYTANLRRAEDEPELNSPWLELSGSTRAGEGQGEVIVVSADEEKTLVFDLPVPEEESQGGYHLEVYLNGKRIFGPGELIRQKTDDDYFTITWRSSVLKSGRYELRVLRVWEGKLDPVRRYNFTISKQ